MRKIPCFYEEQIETFCFMLVENAKQNLRIITSCQTSRSYLDLENVIGISPQAPQDVARDADVDLVSFVGTDRRQEAIDRCGGRGDNRWRH